MSQTSISHLSQTDWESDFVFSGAASDTSQTLVGAEDETDFVGRGGVSHTVVFGGDNGIGGRSLVVGVETGTS